jgi:UDP-glucose 4-epimerase
LQRIDKDQLGKVLVTGGTGFVGSYLAKRLVDESVDVRVMDNNIRGRVHRLNDYMDRLEFVEGDVCDPEQVLSACKDVDTIFHLAFINGTDNFYNFPEKVLEIGVKGAIFTLEAAMKSKVSQYVVTSSSEVYQEPTHIPTTEKERIIIPDIHNPRFSYSGGKIITELLTIHYPAKTNLRTVICRPHNFYGPDMGMGHVIPQFAIRMKKLSNNFEKKEIDFPIQGSGEETRAFCYIDDAIDGLLLLALKGENQNIYHLGTEQEKSIIGLAHEIADILGIKINIQKGALLQGGTTRRCPSIEKIKGLGYRPCISFRQGLEKTVHWYVTQSEKTRKTSRKELIR